MNALSYFNVIVKKKTVHNSTQTNINAQVVNEQNVKISKTLKGVC